MTSPSVLIISTAHANLGETVKKTGLWLEELTTPYYVFADAGSPPTVATLSGGPIPLDPRSVDMPGGLPASAARFLDDEFAAARLRSSCRLADLSPGDFDLIYIPGGHGAMWDLAGSAELGEFLTDAWAEGLVISSVCHGPAGLVNALDVDCKPLVAGKQVTGFSNAEETAMRLAHVVPFLLESRLRALGARYLSGPNFKPFVLRDGRLVTGQNPASSHRVAELALQAVEEERAVLH